MPVELLREIVKQQLPLTITNPADVDKLRVLSAAGHVVAHFPGAAEPQTQAEVIAITAEGRDAAKRALLANI